MTTPTTTDTPATEAVAHIYHAMRVIMAEVRGVPKTGELKNRSGVLQYHYQRYEDMAERVGDACRDHLVFPQSEVKELRLTEWEKKGDGGYVTMWARAVVVKRFIFTSLVDGSTLTVEASGEGSDSSDKAVNKAETSALKNALRHGLLLSTRDEQDPDAERPGEELPRETVRNARPTEPPPDPSSSVTGLDVPGTLRGLVESARTKAKTKADINALWTWAAGHNLLGLVPEGEEQALHVILRASGGMLPDGPS